MGMEAPDHGTSTMDERLRAFGTQLITVHDWLRKELSRLRDDMDAYLDGKGGESLGKVTVGVPHDQGHGPAVDTTSVVVNSFGS